MNRQAQRLILPSVASMPTEAFMTSGSRALTGCPSWCARRHSVPLAGAEIVIEARRWMTNFMRSADSWMLRKDVRPS